MLPNFHKILLVVRRLLEAKSVIKFTWDSDEQLFSMIRIHYHYIIIILVDSYALKCSDFGRIAKDLPDKWHPVILAIVKVWSQVS